MTTRMQWAARGVTDTMSERIIGYTDDGDPIVEGGEVARPYEESFEYKLSHFLSGSTFLGFSRDGEDLWMSFEHPDYPGRTLSLTLKAGRVGPIPLELMVDEEGYGWDREAHHATPPLQSAIRLAEGEL